MNDDDLEEVVESGERLPVEMFDPGLLTEEDALRLPDWINIEKPADSKGE
jgi:hypothetical protein